MNTPHQSPTIEQLQAVERQSLDCLNAIGMALAHGILLGVNIARVQTEDGSVVAPGVMLFIAGEPPAKEGDEPGPIRKLQLTIPQDGTNLGGLLHAAGDFCHGALCKAQAEGMKLDDYFAAVKEIEGIRRNNRRRIVIPGAGRN